MGNLKKEKGEVLIAIILSLLFLGLFLLLNSKEEIYHDEKATFLSKRYTEETTNTIMVYTGKVTVPIIQSVPKKYYFKIDFNHKIYEKEVSDTLYNCVNKSKGDEIDVIVNEDREKLKLAIIC